MEQHDLQHIGDNQNSQWWGAKQGLFINALASQYGKFETDLAYRNTINQNTKFTIESTFNGACTYTNGFLGTPNNGTGVQYLAGADFIPGLQRFIFSFIKNQLAVYGKQTSFYYNSETKPNKISYNSISYDNTIFYSTSPPNFLAFNIYKQRIKNYSTFSGNFGFGISPLWILQTDDLYPIGDTTIRLNVAPIAGVNTFISGIVRDLRIYTRVLESKEVTDNYHAMRAVNRNDLFCEWKMAELTDFYTFGGNLYARNTGISGNGLDNGTGYDIQLLGYAGNVPILQSIY